MYRTFHQWVLVGLACLPPFFASAQLALREKQVPQEIRDDFALRFDAAESVQWLKQGDTYYGARFQLKGRAVEAVYGQDAQWEQTQEEIAYAAMPDQARAYLRQTYPDYTAQAVHKVATRRFGILYEITISGGGKQRLLSFDMHGARLSDQSAEPVPAETAAEAQPEAEKPAPKLQGLFKKGEGR